MSFMNQSEPYIEVIISRTRQRYKATCPAFPNCKGFGDSKEVALEKLGKSIAKHIGGVVNNSVQSLFKKNQYSEIIADPTQKKKHEHRVYSVNNSSKNIDNNILFKFSNDILPKTHQPKQGFNPDYSMDLIEEMNSPLSPFTPIEQTESQDEFLFGIPFCLN